MRSRIFWGVFLILSAAILVVSQLHLIAYTFSFWVIVATIFLIAMLLQSLIYFQIPGVVFSLAFLAILFAKPLGITALVPWTILGAALLISIGLSMILRPLVIKHRPWMGVHHGNFNYGHHKGFVNVKYSDDPDVKTVDAPDVDVYVKMGSSIRYVKSDDFKTANIDVNMGTAKVYFENVTVKDEAIIHVNVSLGNAELYVPSNWNIVKGINNNMSNVNETGSPNVDSDSPIVQVDGLVSLGNLKINYI